VKIMSAFEMASSIEEATVDLPEAMDLLRSVARF
jgi:hypothetical protein